MIEVDAVSIDRGTERVLTGVSVSVDPGEVVGVIGPNGAGKTSLLKSIDGILSPTDGTVRIAGDPVTSLSSRELARRVAVLSQSTDVKFGFSVREIVAMGRTPYAGRLRSRDERAKRIVDGALERTSLTGLAERPITAVSGGERQRVLIARAIAQETPILLLDEPTANLDINHQIATFELVRELTREGKAVVAAIHDLDLAARYCDRLLLLADGLPLALGTPAEVLTASRIETAYGTNAAIRKDPVTESMTVTAIPDVSTHTGVRIHVIGHGGAAGRVCRDLREAGYDVSVGVVCENGPDHAVAQALGIPAVSVPPAAPIDRSTEQAHRELIEDSAATVITPFHLGPLHRHLSRAALTADRAVVIDSVPLDTRNFDGKTGERQWAALTASFPTVTQTELIPRVADLLTESAGASTEPTSPTVADGAGEDREI